MKYTMTYGRNEITLNTVTGDISGDTYGMRDVIKNDLYATWDRDRRVWHSDKLGETVKEFCAYLTRCHKLTAVEETESETETASVEEEAKPATDIRTKAVSRTELVNGNDGFYQVVYYTDGTSRKVFVG